LVFKILYCSFTDIHSILFKLLASHTLALVSQAWSAAARPWVETCHRFTAEIAAARVQADIDERAARSAARADEVAQLRAAATHCAALSVRDEWQRLMMTEADIVGRVAAANA
jgi:hypothetical protein